MNLWESLRVLRRRWPILVTIAVLTLGTIAVTLRSVPPVYESDTTLLLVMPAKADGTAEAINPYLNFGATLVVTGTVLSEAMGQESVAKTLKASGATADYAIVPDPYGQSPTVTITASDPDPKDVGTTLQKVVAATRAELADRQRAAGAPPASWIAAVGVTAPEKPTVIRSDQIRAIAFIGLAGMILALFLAFAAEGLQRRKVTGWADAARIGKAERDSGRLTRTGP